MIFIVREIHLIFHLSISCNMLGGDQIVNQRMEMKSKQFKGLCCEVFLGILDKLQNLSRWLWEYKTPSQLPAEITQSAQSICVISVWDNRQQTVNTDQDKEQALTLTPLPLQKVLCYHGDKAKARASYCWALSSGVSHTPS